MREKGFEILNDDAFTQVLVACDNRQQLDRMTAHMQDSGECWVGGASWFDQSVIRISVCSWATTADDIDRTVEAFVNARSDAATSIDPMTGRKTA